MIITDIKVEMKIDKLPNSSVGGFIFMKLFNERDGRTVDYG